MGGVTLELEVSEAVMTVLAGDVTTIGTPVEGTCNTATLGIPLLVTTVASGPNSDVLPATSVAVALMNWPAGTAVANVVTKLAIPELFVVTLTKPRKVWPWP